MNRKEARKFFMSVEGVNCEKMYFEHLARIVNRSGKNKFVLSVIPRAQSPMNFSKRNAHLPIDKHKGKALPYIHIQDVEDWNDEEQRKKFYAMIDEMRDAEHDFGVHYILGYSNYTFELWMLLHVADMNYSVMNRSAYLPKINQFFHRNYKSLDEFKKEDEFSRILNEFVSLDSVCCAMRRAAAIDRSNIERGNVLETYRKTQFYRDNPATTVHQIVEMMLDICEVQY